MRVLYSLEPLSRNTNMPGIASVLRFPQSAELENKTEAVNFCVPICRVAVLCVLNFPTANLRFMCRLKGRNIIAFSKPAQPAPH